MKYHLKYQYDCNNYNGEDFVKRLLDVSGHNTQDAIAKDIGVTKNTISNWKNGTLPPLDKLLKIADIYSCSTDYLLGIPETDNQDFLNIIRLLLIYCSTHDTQKDSNKDLIDFKSDSEKCTITIDRKFFDLSTTFGSYNSSKRLFDKIDKSQVINYINEIVYQNDPRLM